MAFLPNQQTQQQQDQQQQGQLPQVPLIPTLQGTSGPTASQTGGTGVTNTATPGAAPSSPWQNVTSYLQANQGQSGNVADVLSGRLTDQYNTVNQGIQQANTNFGQQIEGARVPYNQQVADQAKAGPSAFVQDPNNISAFQKMYNAQYGGPEDFSHTQDYAKLSGQVTGAQQKAGLVNQGTQGLMTLLQDAESARGRNPTQGMTALDSLLLQENPNNFTKLSQAASPFAGLTGYLSQTQQGLDTQAKNAAQEAASTKSNLQNQFIGEGGVVPTFNQNMNQALQDASGKVTGYNQNISDILAALSSGQPLSNSYPNWNASNVDPSGTLSALNPFGTGGGVFQSMLKMGLGTGVGPGYLGQFYDAPDQVNQPGLENVMNQQQFADAQALNQLIGPGTVQTPQALGQAFQAPTNYGSYNAQGALTGLLDQLKGQESYLPYMTPEQQSAYLHDYQQLAAYLGMPSPVQGGITPTPPPEPGTGPGLGEGGGPPYLQPPTGHPSGQGGVYYSPRPGQFA